MDHKFRILLIDDDEAWLQMYARRFTRQGHDVTTCSTAHEASKVLNSRDFDVLFCDIKITYQTADGEIKTDGGLYIIQEAKQSNPTLEVVVITGYGTATLARESFKEGVFDFLEKGEHLFEDMTNVLKKISTSKKERLINPDVLAGQEKVKHAEEFKDRDIEIGIDGDWTVRDFIVFFRVLSNLYTFFLVFGRKQLPPAERMEYNYLEKLQKVIENDIHETPVNALKVDQIQFASPGRINLKGIGEPIKELRELIKGLFLLGPERERKSIENKQLAQELRKKKQEDRIYIEKQKVELGKNKLELEKERVNADRADFELTVQKIESIQNIIVRLRENGFAEGQIYSLLGPINKDVNHLAHLIDLQKLNLDTDTK